MANFQQIIVAGHVGQDPELRQIPNGNSVMSFSLAVTEKWRGKNGGQPGEHTEWFRCTLWGERGEKLVSYIHKGDPLMVVGTIRTEKYVDREGNDRYSTKLIVREVQFLKARDAGGGARQQPAQEPQSTESYGNDDVPF